MSGTTGLGILIVIIEGRYRISWNVGLYGKIWQWIHNWLLCQACKQIFFPKEWCWLACNFVPMIWRISLRFFLFVLLVQLGLVVTHFKCQYCTLDCGAWRKSYLCSGSEPGHVMYERNQDFRAWAEKEDICVKFNGYEISKYQPRIYIYIYEKCTWIIQSHGE